MTSNSLSGYQGSTLLIVPYGIALVFKKAADNFSDFHHKVLLVSIAVHHYGCLLYGVLSLRPFVILGIVITELVIPGFAIVSFNIKTLHHISRVLG